MRQQGLCLQKAFEWKNDIRFLMKQSKLPWEWSDEAQSSSTEGLKNFTRHEAHNEPPHSITIVKETNIFSETSWRPKVILILLRPSLAWARGFLIVQMLLLVHYPSTERWRVPGLSRHKYLYNDTLITGHWPQMLEISLLLSQRHGAHSAKQDTPTS